MLMLLTAATAACDDATAHAAAATTPLLLVTAALLSLARCRRLSDTRWGVGPQGDSRGGPSAIRGAGHDSLHHPLH